MATYAVYEEALVPVGTYTHVIDCDMGDDVVIQWISHEAAGVATFAVYGALTKEDRKLTDLDPSTNLYWFPVPATLGGTLANFLTSPNNAIGTDILRICVNARRMLVVMEVTTELSKFSLIVRNRGEYP